MFDLLFDELFLDIFFFFHVLHSILEIFAPLFICSSLSHVHLLLLVLKELKF